VSSGDADYPRQSYWSIVHRTLGVSDKVLEFEKIVSEPVRLEEY
jgi:hypothetical protein